MWITVLLGVTFLGVQAYEYIHAYSELNLKLSSGVYGSTFFMLTGFHGFHVFVGMLMLLFITLRLMKGHFTPRAPLRLRRRGLVLALRRRGLAGPVHPGLLAVSAGRPPRRRTAAPDCGPRGRARGSACRPACRSAGSSPATRRAGCNRNSSDRQRRRAAPVRGPCARSCGSPARPPAQHEHAGAGQRRQHRHQDQHDQRSSWTRIIVASAALSRRERAALRAGCVWLGCRGWRVAAHGARWACGSSTAPRRRPRCRAALDAQRALPPLDAAALARDAPRLAAQLHRRVVLEGRWLAAHTRVPGQPADERPPRLLRRHAAAARRRATRCWCSAAGCRAMSPTARACRAVDTPAGRGAQSRAASPRRRPGCTSSTARAAGAIRQNLDLAPYRARDRAAAAAAVACCRLTAPRRRDGLLRALARSRPPMSTSTTATPSSGLRSAP